MKLLALVLLQLVISQLPLWASENEIIHVQRSLPMSEDEPIYKDYYINVGSHTGLKENLVVKVMRTVHVGKGGKTTDGMKIEVPVGLLKIIYMRPQMAVARLFAIQDVEKAPTLETPAILVGDTVDLTGSFIDAKKTAVAKPKLESKVDFKPEIQSELKAEPKIESKIDLKIESKSDSKGETKLDSKLESKLESLPVESTKEQNIALPKENAGT